MKCRKDLLNENSPAGLTVWQLSDDENRNSSHVYMESAVFTPDSRCMVFELSGQAHFYYPHHADHAFVHCDLEANGSLTPLAGGPHDTALSLCPRGEWAYYIRDESTPGAGKIAFMKVRLDGSEREVLQVIDSPIPGSAIQPSRIYPLSTISSDGMRLATSCFLGDGRSETATWGVLVFDIPTARAEIVYQSPSLSNVHPQYCRSLDTRCNRDLLIQENHGGGYDPNGAANGVCGADRAGADVHVIRDDGTRHRSMPWGRDGQESVVGHQCWRGESESAIGSVTRNHHHLLESLPVPHTGHLGAATPGGERIDLGQGTDLKGFDHFGTDRSGRWLICDQGHSEMKSDLYFADLGEPGAETVPRWTYLLNAKSDVPKNGSPVHPHPFLSPDGRRGFFNSDHTGRLEAYMITGLENLR